MQSPLRIHLFQGYGVELEYMLVDRDTLQIKPITDELLKAALGEIGSDYENGMVTWSNELVMHVVELKSTRPENNFNALENEFASNVKRINALLHRWNAMLLPTAAHPFMDPLSETKLWPHDSNEIYEIYNRIFDCRGHGWSNLQSTHLNLPFYDDEEFAKLHAAVRLVLPILPALCASSPILDGRPTGLRDSRLKFYRTNQSRIPSITGRVIPEAVFSKRNYINVIYEKIKADISSFDTANLLDPIWVNSRGAIPRFDRGSIEIRVMDIQECPAADLAIATLVIETIKALVNEEFVSCEQQMKWKTEALVSIFDQATEKAEEATIDSKDYLSTFGFPGDTAKTSELWRFIWDTLNANTNSLSNWKSEIDVILKEGSLASRIMKSIGPAIEREQVLGVYKKLAGCLDQNKVFLP